MGLLCMCVHVYVPFFQPLIFLYDRQVTVCVCDLLFFLLYYPFFLLLDKRPHLFGEQK